MGYSCSRRASYTLDVILTMSQFDCESDNFEFFCEIGRENADGSITGTVYKMLEVGPSKDGKTCKKHGSFKIGADGFIVRFPGLDKFLWGIPHIAMIERYDREVNHYEKQLAGV